MGTALKPAFEPIIMAQKPLAGTYLENYAQHGTGALNIDASRVATVGESPAAKRRESARNTGNAPMSDRVLGSAKAADTEAMGKIGRRGSAEVYMAERPSEQLGRWPANSVLTHSPNCVRVGTKTAARGGGGTGDFGKHGRYGLAKGTPESQKATATTEDVPAYECVPGCPVAALDSQSGTSSSVERTEKRPGKRTGTLGEFQGQDNVKMGHSDSGGASRFYPTFEWEDADFEPFLYCAKAARKEREAGTHKCTCGNEAPSESEAPQVATQAETATPPPKATTESTSEADSEWPTSSHGKTPMGDQSPMGSKSITETKTSRTTTPQTSNSLMPPPTSDSTPAANSEGASGGSLAASVGTSSPSPKNTGISARKDGRSMDDAAPVTSASLSRKSESGSSGAWCHDCHGLKAGHPTVKPVALMRWLVRLVTPPGGTVLDPFAGSGTTGIAATLEGFRFVGIELDPDYHRIAEARIQHAQRWGEAFAQRVQRGVEPETIPEPVPVSPSKPATLEDFL